MVFAFLLTAAVVTDVSVVEVTTFDDRFDVSRGTCSAVTRANCGKDTAHSCMQCGSASAYDCEMCCPGCHQVASGTYKWCNCGTGPTPPSPPANEQFIHANITWNGKVRTYAMHVPNKTAPTGLILVLEPASAEYIDIVCRRAVVGNVTAATGAIVVCPAAQVLGPKTDNSSSPCWKAFQNYGYCQNTPSGGSVPEDSEDVDFLAALIKHLQAHYPIPAGKVLVSGMSNGGSMAYRFYCEKSELIGGAVIQSQAYFDPYVGYYDYVNKHVPMGTPQCHPTFKRPFYSDIGTYDIYYGPNATTPGFQGIDKWRHNFSKAVLGCTGEAVLTTKGPHTLPGAAGKSGGTNELLSTCYEFPEGSCPSMTAPGINRFCSVAGLSHDDTPLSVLLPRAFKEFFP